MLESCFQCRARIIWGARKYLDRPFCSDDCRAEYQQQVIEAFLGTEELNERIHQAFAQPCPNCGVDRGNDVFTASRATGFIIWHHVNHAPCITCHVCGRVRRLLAMLHTGIFGWWCGSGLWVTPWYLIANALGFVFLRIPRQPSERLARFVKISLANEFEQEILAELRRTSDPEGW